MKQQEWNVLSLKMLILAAMLYSGANTSGQYLLNPSLEGTLGDDEPPEFWHTDNSWSDPDLLASYPRTNPRYFPVDGNNFCLFRARGATYNESYHAPYQREYLYQELAQPLEVNACFRFDASLCYNPDYEVNDTEDPDRGYPLRFQIWGANSPGVQDALLYESETLGNAAFESFSFIFTTYDTSYAYIFLTVMWDTVNVKSQAYNGMILVDDLDLVKLQDAEIRTEYTLYYQGDRETILTASAGEGYFWYPASPVSSTSSRSVLLNSFTEEMTVLISTTDGCSYIEKFHLILDCDTLYPAGMNENHEYYYTYEKDIVLEATAGLTYDWNPKSGLSAYDTRSPSLLEYAESYNVLITDRYNCSFNDYFTIRLSCDTLYPGGQIEVLDTLIEPNASVTLIPRYGSIAGAWSPAQFLNCTGCQTPISSPRNTVSYSVQLEDEFGCTHTEFFNLEIDLYIPNVITPNGDDFNQCLKVFGLPDGTAFYLYDKQGLLLYHTSAYKPDDCWEGTDQNGNPLKAGNYWYGFVHPVQGTLKTGFLLIKR
jgi:gliding motility-associated-like protein